MRAIRVTAAVGLAGGLRTRKTAVERVLQRTGRLPETSLRTPGTQPSLVDLAIFLVAWHYYVRILEDVGHMLKFVDLFCGAGFGARGAVRGGGKPLLGIDSWKLATDTYKSNFPVADVLQSLIQDLDPYSLKKKYSPDVLLTSPECTAHSIARGLKKGSEPA